MAETLENAHCSFSAHLRLPAGEALAALLGSKIALRNWRRLQTAMRSARLPAVKTLADFDFTFQPSVKRD